nr:hypothetical protein [Pseudodesulfovibrio sp.]
MFWTTGKQFQPYPFNQEAELEKTILKVESDLFGPKRIYLDPKKKIGVKGKVRNIPDGYLIDLSSNKVPVLYVVENELAKHDPLRHIAVQILQFSLSFESSPSVVKAIIKDALSLQKDKWNRCEEYAKSNDFENVDYLLESMIFGEDKFRALVIIDECVDELEKVLVSRFKFPVEIVTLERFNAENEVAYFFEPFLSEVTADTNGIGNASLDPEEIDTVVVPARDEGFQEVFLGEDRWYSIRLHSSMIPKLRYIATYRVAPISAITHIASIKSIESWKDTGKYVVNFEESAKEIEPIPLVTKGRVRALQGLRYTAKKRLEISKNLDQLF